jgi:hypothetical protein
MPDEKIDQKRPAHADSELKKMQQRLVDDTVDDSFPASDPPAWTTTGTKSVAAKASGTPGEDATVSGEDDGPVARASRLAGQVYEAGRQYARDAQQRLPEAERYVREGRRVAARPVEAYPLTALILAGATGFGLAWFIYRGNSRVSRDIAPYGKRPRYGWRPGPMSHSERQRADAHLASVSRAAGAASSTPNSF